MTNTRLMQRAPRLDPEQQGNKVKQSEHPGTPTWVMQCRSNECAAVENNTECVELGSPFYRQIISVQNYHLSTNVMRWQNITIMYMSACVLRWIIIHSFANTASTNIHRCHVHTCFETFPLFNYKVGDFQEQKMPLLWLIQLPPPATNPSPNEVRTNHKAQQAINKRSTPALHTNAWYMLPTSFVFLVLPALPVAYFLCVHILLSFLFLSLFKICLISFQLTDSLVLRVTPFVIIFSCNVFAESAYQLLFFQFRIFIFLILFILPFTIFVFSSWICLRSLDLLS